MKISKVLILIVVIGFLEVSCKEEKAKKANITTKVSDNFEMYKTSEMAALMRMMTEKNNRLKNAIISGKDVGEFDKEYLKIHTAELTDSTDYDLTYKAFAEYFIKVQKDVFKTEKLKRKKAFNTAINACIACHKEKCSGPIPRIKKLLIP